MTDLAVIESGLVVYNDAGEPTGVVMPGTGEVVSFTDLPGLALWARTITDLKYDELQPVERMVGEAINQHLNHAGQWTIHLDNGLTVVGESPAVGEAAWKTDGKALYEDLQTLRRRDTKATDETQADLDAWVGKFFKVEVSLTEAGRKRLDKMGGEYRAALAEHTESAPKAQARPSVRRSK